MLAGRIGNYSRYEIERKFVISRLPEILPLVYVDIHDVYLKNSSLRLRTERSPSGEVVGRKLTKKEKANNKGEETSIITSLYLSERDVLALGKLEGMPIFKRRYIEEYSDRRVVYDEFQAELSGLIMAEVEFRDYASLLHFELKNVDWEEVTGNADFSGGNLAFKAKT